MKQATFGSGCFWCTEAIFQNLKGVEKAQSGYSGGHVENPSYEQVCAKTTGHAEVVQVTYDESIISFEELLEVFWNTHDPTTPDRQGNDVGPQYRSVVFYHDEEQREKTAAYKKQLEQSVVFNDPIVTEVSPLINFYPAEDYHNDYYNRNGHQPYCSFVVRPKVEKFKKKYAERLQEKVS